MKKLVAFILCMALVITCVACFAACNDTAKTYEIAVVTCLLYTSDAADE